METALELYRESGNAAGVDAVQRQLNQAAGPLSLGIWGPAQDAVYWPVC